MVLEAALGGYCNTTRDIADETGLRVEIVSHYVSEFIADGVLKRTGLSMPTQNDKRQGPPFLVFEPSTLKVDLRS